MKKTGTIIVINDRVVTFEPNYIIHMQLSLQGVVPIPLREKIAAGRSAVWNSTVSFSKGEYLFVQAPSGTGKTTLVHVLYGLRNDYTGSVKWNSHELAKTDAETIAGLRARNLSVIFQDMRLFPELTAWENIEIKRKLTDTVTTQQVEAWMGRLGISEKRNSLGATLSYGEQQRVAIIRALVQPFEWLLMDEPFSHLDHANTAKAATLVLEVVQQHKAGMILADLDENTYFPYTKTIML
ncbi:MAG: ATP-binding cassette domain-containing protein [Bacteroidota bacterium]